MIDRRSRYEGSILGLAIGDALGWPVEFLRLDAIRAKYGPAGISDLAASRHHPAGTYTDDTQMSMAVARAILSHGHCSEGEFLDAVVREFVTWSQSPDNDRAPGNTCMAACRELIRDSAWRAVGNNDSKGCGTAMRSAPIGLAWHGDEKTIIRLAAATSKLTHGHPCATAGSVATALLVSWALDDMDPGTMVDRLIHCTSKISTEFSGHIARVPEVLGEEPESAYKLLGEAWVAEEAVACALYAFCRSPRDYAQTVRTAVNMDGDSDSVGCIAGAISGAFNGREAIPAAWVASVENSRMLSEMGRALAEFARRPLN